MIRKSNGKKTFCQWAKPGPCSVLLFASLGLLVAGCQESPKPATARPEVPEQANAQPTDPEASEANNSVTATAVERACTQDSECQLVPLNCCSCRNGGSQSAIHQTHMAALKARRAKLCGEVMCAQMMGIHESCLASTAICANGVCVPKTLPKGFPVKTTPLPGARKTNP